MSSVGSVPFDSLAPRRVPHRIIIAHGDKIRAFNVRPWFAGMVLLFGSFFGVLYLLATGYLIFRDDLLAASISRQSRMQHAYEDRIASLRADIDRLTSRQLLNQEAFDAKLERLLGKQAALDARQDIIASLSQAARRAGIDPSVPAAPLPSAADTSAPVATDDAATAPAEDAVDTPDAAESTAPNPTKVDPITTGSIVKAGAAANVAVAMLRTGTDVLPASDATRKIGAVELSLNALAQDQVAYVEAVGDEIAGRTKKIAGILKKLGQDVPAAPGASDDVGGPFIPLDANADPETFRTNVELINSEIDRFTQVRRIAAQLPLSPPIGNAVITSGFGARLDPFFGRPAMHPGIDFRAPLGYPVRSTAGGTVIIAGYSGGYGNMVEIDHGNGG